MQIFTSSLHLNGKYLNYLDHEDRIIKKCSTNHSKVSISGLCLLASTKILITPPQKLHFLVCLSFISLCFHIIIVIIIDFHQQVQQTILKLAIHCFSYIFHYHIDMW